MRLDQLLFSQGFGTRRVCAGLIEQGLVSVGGTVCTEPGAEFDTAAEGLAFTAVHEGRVVGTVRLWHVSAGGSPARPDHRAHGATASALSTDSRTGALGLYERIGMRVTSTWLHRAVRLS